MTRLGRIAVLGAAGLLALAAATGVASASTGSAAAPDVAPAGVLGFNHGGSAIAPAAASDLVYHGGPIQDSPHVYLVFWGKQWTSDKNGVQAYLTNFFSGLGRTGDNWSRVASQYTGRGKHPTFTGSVLKGTFVDSAANAPTNMSASAIANEARKGASHFGVSGVNVNIIVVSPHGTHPDGFPNAGFCAYHDATGGLPYTNMPYVLDAGSSCGQGILGGKLDGFSIVAGHEYMEAVTDPQPPSGWVARNGEENGDICAWKGLHKLSLSTGSFAVQPTYSNAVHGCAG